MKFRIQTRFTGRRNVEIEGDSLALLLAANPGLEVIGGHSLQFSDAAVEIEGVGPGGEWLPSEIWDDEHLSVQELGREAGIAENSEALEQLAGVQADLARSEALLARSEQQIGELTQSLAQAIAANDPLRTALAEVTAKLEAAEARIVALESQRKKK